MAGPQWKRLGEQIKRRRIELGMTTREQFAAASGFTTRVLGDLEVGRRDNYDADTLTRVELTLRWDAGSINAVLDGKEPLVSGVIRGHSGRTLQQWTGIEGSDQTELEVYRLAHLVMDTRDLIRSQKGPLATAVSSLLDEATDLAVRRVAQWRSGCGDEAPTAEAIKDALWFIDETRGTNAIRRLGDIYVTENDSQAIWPQDDIHGAESDTTAFKVDIQWAPEDFDLSFQIDPDLPDRLERARVDPEVIQMHSEAMGDLVEKTRTLAAVAASPHEAPVVDTAVVMFQFAIERYVIATNELAKAIESIDLHASREQIDVAIDMFHTNTAYANALLPVLRNLTQTLPNEVLRQPMAARLQMVEDLIERLASSERAWVEAGRAGDIPLAARTAPHGYTPGKSEQGGADEEGSQIDPGETD